MTTAISPIVSIQNDHLTTTTFAIAEGTQREHKAVIQLVRTYASDLSEFGQLAFEMGVTSSRGAGQKTEYAILNEPQSTLLLTYMRNSDIVRQFKKKLIKAFYEMREQLNNAPQQQVGVPNNLQEALILAAQLEGQRTDLQTTIQRQQPKVDFANQVVSTTGAIPIGAFAKTLGTGQNRLFKFLRQKKVLLDNGTNLPYQQHLDCGRFNVISNPITITHRDGEVEDVMATKTLITGKGQLYVHNLITQDLSDREQLFHSIKLVKQLRDQRDRVDSLAKDGQLPDGGSYYALVSNLHAEHEKMNTLAKRVGKGVRLFSDVDPSVKMLN